MERLTAEEFYVKKFKEYIPEYHEENMLCLLDESDQSDEAVLFRTNLKILIQYAEQEAKEFAEFTQKEGWQYIESENIWHRYISGQATINGRNYDPENNLTFDELYQQFKNKDNG